MRVRREFDCRPGEHVYTIQQAALMVLSPSEYGRGQLEELEDRTSELVTFVSRLFEMLAEKGILTRQETLEMLEGYEEVGD